MTSFIDKPFGSFEQTEERLFLFTLSATFIRHFGIRARLDSLVRPGSEFSRPDEHFSQSTKARPFYKSEQMKNVLVFLIQLNCCK